MEKIVTLKVDEHSLKGCYRRAGANGDRGRQRDRVFAIVAGKAEVFCNADRGQPGLKVKEETNHGLPEILFQEIVTVLDCTGTPPFTGQVRWWRATASRPLPRRATPLALRRSPRGGRRRRHVDAGADRGPLASDLPRHRGPRKPGLRAARGAHRCARPRTLAKKTPGAGFYRVQQRGVGQGNAWMS